MTKAKNQKKHPQKSSKNDLLINDDDSDSEIVEEEIITEETIAKIYAEHSDQLFLEKKEYII